MILMHTNRDMRIALNRGLNQVAQKGFARIGACTGGACRITGLLVASAAIMIALTCSILLTLNAGRP